MIYWEEEALNDSEKIFEYLYAVNPVIAEKTDELIETKVETLLVHPLMGGQRTSIPGRFLSISEVSMLVSYWLNGSTIRVMRVLHQKQQFPG